jgi:hypothetical protein
MFKGVFIPRLKKDNQRRKIKCQKMYIARSHEVSTGKRKEEDAWGSMGSMRDWKRAGWQEPI